MFMLNRNVTKTLKSVETERVQLSIDGKTEEVNDSIRGPGSFMAVLKAAFNLRDAGLDFSTSLMLNSLNHQQSVEFIRIKRRKMSSRQEPVCNWARWRDLWLRSTLGASISLRKRAY
jgi:sulfatase maturation enzyme AslB (radical SAM superfamily)